MVPETLINELVTLVTTIPGVILKEVKIVLYLALILLVAFSPLILALIVSFIYTKLIDRNGYDHQWAKTGLLLLGFRYSMKWLTMILFDKRRR